jgi:hypothetical protein
MYLHGAMQHDHLALEIWLPMSNCMNCGCVITRVYLLIVDLIHWVTPGTLTPNRVRILKRTVGDLRSDTNTAIWERQIRTYRIGVQRTNWHIGTRLRQLYSYEHGSAEQHVIYCYSCFQGTPTSEPTPGSFISRCVRGLGIN